MALSDIFTLDKSIAPRLIKILYVLALILIALGVIAGVSRGIASMARAPGPRIAAMAPAPAAGNQAAAPSAAAQTAPGAQPGVGGGPRFAYRQFGGPAFRGRAFRGPRFGMMRRQPPMLLGTFEIVRALVMGAIAVMVVRILAELAGAILKMPRKE